MDTEPKTDLDFKHDAMMRVIRARDRGVEQLRFAPMSKEYILERMVQESANLLRQIEVILKQEYNKENI